MTPNEWKVVLCRQPWLDNKGWKHDSKQGAITRAYNLAELHGKQCKVTILQASQTIYVHAGAYYAKKGG